MQLLLFFGLFNLIEAECCILKSHSLPLDFLWDRVVFMASLSALLMAISMGFSFLACKEIGQSWSILGSFFVLYLFILSFYFGGYPVHSITALHPFSLINSIFLYLYASPSTFTLFQGLIETNPVTLGGSLLQIYSNIIWSILFTKLALLLQFRSVIVLIMFYWCICLMYIMFLLFCFVFLLPCNRVSCNLWW